MQVKQTRDGEIVAIFHAKELLAFVRSYLEIGMGALPMKLVLEINLGDHLVAMGEKEILRWGDNIQ